MRTLLYGHLHQLGNCIQPNSALLNSLPVLSVLAFLGESLIGFCCLQGCNAAGLDAELARFAALLNELLLRGFDMEAQSTQVHGQTYHHLRNMRA